MTVHLIKLCVGVDTVKELAEWQDERLMRLALQLPTDWAEQRKMLGFEDA